MRAPRAAEVRLVALARQFAVEEQVAERAVRLRGGRRDVAAVLAVDVAVLEHRDAAAEDEVDSTLDVGVGEVRAALVEVERVLPTEHAAVVIRLPLALRPQRDGLGDVARGVLEREVVCADVAGLYQRAGRPARADFLRLAWE